MTPEERIDRYLLEQANSEDIEILNKLLERDEELRQTYRFRVALEGGYREAVLRENAGATYPASIDQHKPQPARIVAAEFHPWKWAVAAAAAFVLLVTFVIATTPARHVAKVIAILGPCQYITADGKVREEVKVGTVLRVGDTIRPRSSSTFAKLALNDGSVMIITGRSRLRLLNVDGRRGFQLAYGNLWATVGKQGRVKPLLIQTPTATIEAVDALFHLEAHPTTSIIRVNAGFVNVEREVDGQTADVAADHHAVVSLSRNQPFAAARRPEPVNEWNCSMLAGRGAVFGKILPPTAEGRSRLEAVPVITAKHTTVYVANFSVQCSGSPPVLIESGSKVRITGNTQTENPIYIGLTTQRIKGGFFGNYSAKVGAEPLGQAGEPWQVEVPLNKFKSKFDGMSTHIPGLPIGMELTDICVFSLEESAELEIHRVEFLPREVGQ
jgi:hypothetical protein